MMNNVEMLLSAIANELAIANKLKALEIMQSTDVANLEDYPFLRDICKREMNTNTYFRKDA